MWGALPLFALAPALAAASTADSDAAPQASSVSPRTAQALASLGGGEALTLDKAPCLCPKGQSFQALVKRSEAIFVGRLLRTEDSNWIVPLLKPSSFRNIFKVAEIYKGEPYAHAIVKTFAAQGRCGLGAAFFKPHRDYLVFAVRDAGDLVTGVCEGSMEKARAAAYVKALGLPRPPTKKLFYVTSIKKKMALLGAFVVFSVASFVLAYKWRRAFLGQKD